MAAMSRSRHKWQRHYTTACGYSGVLQSTVLCSLSEHARVHLGIYNVRQYLPVYFGQTLKFSFAIADVVDKGEMGDIVTSKHIVKNDADQPVLTLTKKTLFPKGLFKHGSDQSLLDVRTAKNVV